jgi:hypothetical protein
MEAAAQHKGLAWPTFQGDEMRDLVEYIKLSATPQKQASN